MNFTANKNAFVRVDHRIAGAIFRQRENQLCGLRNLSNFGVSCGNDAIGIGFQFRLLKGIAGSIHLRLCGLDRALCCQKRFLRLVEGGSGGHTGIEETLLAVEGLLRLHLLRFSRLKCRHRNLKIGFLLLRVDAGENLALRHVVADVDQTFGYAAANAKGKIGLNARADFSRDRDLIGGFKRFDLNRSTRRLGFSTCWSSGVQAVRPARDAAARALIARLLIYCLLNRDETLIHLTYRTVNEIIVCSKRLKFNG